jgi:protein TIF31
MNNAAVMLQSLKHFTDSRLWFETSLSVCEELFGKQSPQAATILFQLAQALALDHDSKGAVKRMREAYNIYLAQLGPNDRNTKEAEGWLEQLTQNAVSIAKQAKDIQNRKYRRITLMPRASLGTRPQPQVGQNAAEISQSDPRSSIGLDSRSIDELLKFIEGDTGASRSKKRNRTANPKLRATKQVQTPVEAA